MRRLPNLSIGLDARHSLDAPCSRPCRGRWRVVWVSFRGLHRGKGMLLMRPVGALRAGIQSRRLANRSAGCRGRGRNAPFPVPRPGLGRPAIGPVVVRGMVVLRAHFVGRTAGVIPVGGSEVICGALRVRCSSCASNSQRLMAMRQLTMVYSGRNNVGRHMACPGGARGEAGCICRRVVEQGEY